MSAQAGMWNVNGNPVEDELFARTNSLLAESELDGETVYFEASIKMAYWAFHTTGESKLERQPHCSSTGKVLTWDGRLDNREELTAALQPDLRADESDVAIVSAAFDRWGTAAFSRLIGDWAVAVWDPSRKELILARDYIGVRQLFYYPTSHRVLWSTYLAPLALSGDRFTLCDEYIAGYFGYWPEAHLTPYREIHSVPPGHFICIRRGQVNKYAYWKFDPAHILRYKSDAEYEEHFLHLFRQSVRRRLRTDRPILAELSGGLDSSSIVCMADDILSREGSEAPSIDTISYWDRGEPDEEDFLYFTKVEEQRGRVGHHAEIRGLGDTFSFLEQHGFVAAPGFQLRAEFKAAQVEVIRRCKYRIVFSGIGGDELLGQALDPRVEIADLIARLQLRKVVNQIIPWSLFLRRPLVQLLCQAFAILLPTSIRTRMKAVRKLEPWLNEQFARKFRVTDRLLPATQGSVSWLPSVRDSYQVLGQLAGQLTDVPPSLTEARYPFLDQTLTTFLVSIPREQLYRPGQRRSLMRRSLRHILPKEILSRKTKSGTGRCEIVTLEKHWKELQDLLCAPLTCRLGYLDKTRFENELLSMKNGRIPIHVGRLLRGLALEFWLRDAIHRGVISLPNSISRNCETGVSRSVTEQHASGS